MIGILQFAPEDFSGHTGAVLERRFWHVARVRICVDGAILGVGEIMDDPAGGVWIVIAFVEYAERAGENFRPYLDDVGVEDQAVEQVLFFADVGAQDRQAL
ncbi:hypothetical protein PF005_g26666 [Phytophthora fragariae]|uniref:Uncharacterized protein n=1 Tax=Phytophthora fragariae TaxID=53985 RepID=A0A6A3W940_9STRA|nr:hypothetical protein PF005_g26666 [Phytophthora fragariae]KAE9181306.1 hypothetical protein PF002_g27308 [Phytophthora fragariae]